MASAQQCGEGLHTHSFLKQGGALLSSSVAAVKATLDSAGSSQLSMPQSPQL